jgi:6-phosphogluconolactonase
VHELASANDVPSLLAKDIAQRLQQAIQTRGRAVLSVSGGKSPIALFEQLRDCPIEWSHVHITLVDERCVANTHEASNARLVRAHLIQGLASVAHFIPMVPDEVATVDHDLSAPSLQWLTQQADLALSPHDLADVMILGMGADGHTASLFPDAPALTQALDMNNPARCQAIELAHPPANAPFARITQTLRQLLRSRHLILSISGEDKRQTLSAALEVSSLSGHQLPIAHVLNQRHTPIALWISP